MSKQQTTKKVKFVGTQQMIDMDGVIHEMQVTDIEDRDFNFHKVWMKSFISTLDMVGNQKTRLAFWIIENLNKENQLTMTYRQISNASGISLDTVSKTMSILLESDFLRKINQGCYMVNPDVLFKGSRNGRLNILNQYRDADRVDEVSKEQTLMNLCNTIAKLQKRADALMKEVEDERKARMEQNVTEQKIGA